MNHTVVIYDMGDSEWISCQVIKENLVNCYRKKEEEVLEIHLSSSSTPKDKLEIYNKIVEIQPERIVFLDGVPHPKSLLPFFNINDFNIKPDLIFHVYGDFSIRTDLWADIESKLIQYKCLFFAASDKQVELMKLLIKSPENIVKKCPFAIDETNFYYDVEARNETRKELGIKEDEICLLYTGRLSFQKNIHMLLKFYAFIANSYKKKIKLYIVGDFDDMGAPFIGRHFPDFHYFHYIYQMVISLNRGNKFDIQLTGNLDRENLHRMYNASDLFVSFSVHNDEDYGMSPIESLACGTPAIITDWGGFYSFKSQYCKLIPTKIVDTSIKVNLPTAIKQTVLMLNNPPERKKVVQYYHDKLGVKKVRENMWKDLKAGKFKGFSQDFFEVRNSFKESPSAPFKVKEKESIISEPMYNELYKRLYKTYES